MRLTLLYWMALLLPVAVSAVPDTDTVETAPIYYERMPNDLMRFFFDDRYFLTDKYCRFKAIERVGTYDTQQQKFLGRFTDFDQSGRAILRGNYQDGKRHGEFRAYHPNGELKWEVTYEQGKPKGIWCYYYPDGRPMLEVDYRDSSTFLKNFWDRKGRQQVKEGNGKYEMAVEIDGYDEFGAVRYIRSGKVVMGKPDGLWTVRHVFNDGKQQTTGHELFRRGKFVEGYDELRIGEYRTAPQFGFLPVDFSIRAEAMTGKRCTIDEYSGFTGYLAHTIEEAFSHVPGPLPDPIRIAFTVDVDRSGKPRKITTIKTFERKALADQLLEALNWIGFWFPSFDGSDYIDDTLTVTAEIFPVASLQSLSVYDVVIHREGGI